VPTLPLHGINGDSARNYNLIDEKSTGGMEFRQELPAHRQGIHLRKGIPPGITSLFTRIQAGKTKCVENPSNGNNSRISSSKSNILTMATFLKFKYKDLFKVKKKPDPALL
jgi:hypothetical protein